MPSNPYFAERKVLYPRDPNLQDENAWPIFSLLNAEVKGPNGRIVNLLHANPEAPVTVTGYLDVKGADKTIRAAILPAYKTQSRVPLILKNCHYFAYGAYENGDVVIWISGEAGWHQIKPADSYIEMFQHMTQSITMLYYLTDSHVDGDKVSAKDIFKGHASIHHISPKEAQERFEDHAEFLASRMIRGDENIDWTRTSIFRHLRKARPDAFIPKSGPAVSAPEPAPAVAPASAVPASVASRASAARQTTRGTRSRSVTEEVRTTRSAPSAKPATRATEAPEATAGAPRRPARPSLKKKEQSAPTKPTQDLLSQRNKVRAREVWKFIQRKTNETLPEVGEMRMSTFARFLYQNYELPDETEAEYLLGHLAPDLVGMMAVPRGRSYDPWTELPIYDELMEVKVPARVRGRIAALELQQRATPLAGEADESEASEMQSDSSEEEVMDAREATIRKREAARRRISALRPKSASKHSSKSTKRKDKFKAVDEDDEMVDAGDEDDRMSIDTPSKRKTMSDEGGDHSEDEEDEDTKSSPEYPNKRFTRSRGDVDPELEDLEFEIQQARSTGLAIRRKFSQSAPPPANGTNGAGDEVEMGLIPEPIEDLNANAPGDIWNCPYGGCVHKVYGASELENKELIREHFASHREKQQRVDLLMSEENMTRLPVSHLLRRIREMAERSGESGESIQALGDGTLGLFPPPLERILG